MQEEAVHHREDSGVGADAERKSKDGDDGKAGRLGEHPATEGRVAPKSFKPESGTLFAAIFLGFDRGAKSDAGLTFSFRPRKARALEVVSLSLNVCEDFFVEFVPRLSAAERHGCERT